MASKPLGLATRIPLPNAPSQTIPQLHLGLYLTSGRETSQATTWALESGYHGFDSAQMYGNEKEAGDSIETFLSSKSNTAGLKREDIFFTSKLSTNGKYDAVRRSISASVKRCGLGYIDLFLLHSPYGGKIARIESWHAVEDAINDGEIRIGGISNFGVRHIQELIASHPRIVPAVNQIEVHPFNTRTAIVEECKRHGIVVEAYAPLARALRMKHPLVQELSAKHGCDPGQLLVRWSMQKGFVALPKSSQKQRIALNGDVGGFEIDEEDVERLDACDEYLVTDWFVTPELKSRYLSILTVVMQGSCGLSMTFCLHVVR